MHEHNTIHITANNFSLLHWSTGGCNESRNSTKEKLLVNLDVNNANSNIPKKPKTECKCKLDVHERFSLGTPLTYWCELFDKQINKKNDESPSKYFLFIENQRSHLTFWYWTNLLFYTFIVFVFTNLHK